jgi:hypothetical protein
VKGTLFWAKCKWLFFMTLLLTPPYWLTNHYHFFEGHEVPRLALDNAIPFMPHLAWIYILLFPFMWWSVLCQKSVNAAKWNIWGGALCAYGVSVIFLLYPTTFARVDESSLWLYSKIIASDTIYNACPSLHGSYSIYAALWVARAYKKPAVTVLVSLLVVLIFFATIAVRQHGIIDLSLGGLLGGLCFLWARKHD